MTKRVIKPQGFELTQYGVQIKAGLRKSGDSQLELAKLIAQADKLLSADDLYELKKWVKICDSDWSKYVRVGNDERLAKSPVREICATGYTIAYGISFLTDEVIQKAIADGTLYHGVRRSEVERLRQKSEAESAANSDNNSLTQKSPTGSRSAGSVAAKSGTPIKLPKPFVYGLIYPKVIKATVLNKVAEHLEGLRSLGIEIIDGAWEKEHKKWEESHGRWVDKIYELMITEARNMARKDIRRLCRQKPSRNPGGKLKKGWENKTGYDEKIFENGVSVEEILVGFDCDTETVESLWERMQHRVPLPEFPELPYEIEQDIPPIMPEKIGLFRRRNRDCSDFIFESPELSDEEKIAEVLADPELVEMLKEVDRESSSGDAASVENVAEPPTSSQPKRSSPRRSRRKRVVEKSKPTRAKSRQRTQGRTASKKGKQSRKAVTDGRIRSR